MFFFGGGKWGWGGRFCWWDPFFDFINRGKQLQKRTQDELD